MRKTNMESSQKTASRVRSIHGQLDGWEEWMVEQNGICVFMLVSFAECKFVKDVQVETDQCKKAILKIENSWFVLATNIRPTAYARQFPSPKDTTHSQNWTFSDWKMRVWILHVHLKTISSISTRNRPICTFLHFLVWISPYKTMLSVKMQKATCFRCHVFASTRGVSLVWNRF